MKNDSFIDSLGISNDFIFCKVMQDEKLLRELLHRIFPQIDFTDLNIAISQKDINEFNDSHGIRIDVYADTGKEMFAVEMQMSRSNFSTKRIRYIGSTMDMYDLSKGSKYDTLKDRYIVFICPFDPFGANMIVYTIENIVKETGKNSGDGTVSIIINCKGKDNGDYSQLRTFADYVMGKASADECEDEYILQLQEAVRYTLNDPLVRRELMDIQEKEYYARKEGKAEGKAEERAELIRNMMESGFSFEQTCVLFKLTEEQIKEVREYMKEN